MEADELDEATLEMAGSGVDTMMGCCSICDGPIGDCITICDTDEVATGIMVDEAAAAAMAAEAAAAAATEAAD